MNENYYIRTFTGKKFYPFNPHPDQICIEDIAAGLSKICRFTGQIHEFYSVAEHSVYVSRLLPDNFKLAGLMHDASEAYLADIAKPVKCGLPDYQSLEARIVSVICGKFNIKSCYHALVKQSDWSMLLNEFRYFYGQQRFEEDFPGQSCNGEVNMAGAGLNHQAARALFLKEFEMLTSEKTFCLPIPAWG